MRLEPDLVVGTPSTDPLDLTRAARESDAITYVQPAGSVDVERAALELGLLGAAPQARKLVADIRRGSAEIERRVADQPLVPAFVDTGFLITVGNRSLAGDLVRRARGRNVAGANPGPEPFEACDVTRLGTRVVLVLADRRQRTPREEFAACPGAGSRPLTPLSCSPQAPTCRRRSKPWPARCTRMPSAEQLDAVTVDAFGTVVELGEPYDRLGQALAERGVERSREEVARAFAAEVAHYLPRAHEGRDAESLGRLRRQCAGVFLAEAVRASIRPSSLRRSSTLEFHVLRARRTRSDVFARPGSYLYASATGTCRSPTTCAESASHFFAAVVSSAEAGAPKPDPRPFELALSRVGVGPERALHVGDSDADHDGARAAGLAFEPVPLATLPARLGL